MSQLRAATWAWRLVLAAALVGASFNALDGNWSAAFWAAACATSTTSALMALSRWQAWRELADGTPTQLYLEGVADTGARLVGVVGAEVGDTSPLVGRMVQAVGDVARARDPRRW